MKIVKALEEDAARIAAIIRASHQDVARMFAITEKTTPNIPPFALRTGY